MLADDAAVSEVVFGPDGFLGTLPRGAVHISASTISVKLSDTLQQEHEEHGQKYLAAPVFGRPEAAAAAKLYVVVAGQADTIKQCDPLFSTIGQRTYILGDKPSMANVVKLSGNFMIASLVESLGEAVALVRKYGVDPHQYLEMLTSSLFNAPVYKTYGALIVEQKFEPAGFKLKLGLKDTRLVLQAGDDVAAPLPIASLVRDHYLVGMANGMEDKDWSALGLLAAQRAGLK
jgi:3-hydroxyisobutyrate dehydrogenase-like beta-hydroxyacid dehydrogenase